MRGCGGLHSFHAAVELAALEILLPGAQEVGSVGASLQIQIEGDRLKPVLLIRQEEQAVRGKLQGPGLSEISESLPFLFENFRL